MAYPASQLDRQPGVLSADILVPMQLALCRPSEKVLLRIGLRRKCWPSPPLGVILPPFLDSITFKSPPIDNYFFLVDFTLKKSHLHSYSLTKRHAIRHHGKIFLAVNLTSTL